MKTIMPFPLMTTLAVCSGLTWGAVAQANPRIQEQAPPWMQSNMVATPQVMRAVSMSQRPAPARAFTPSAAVNTVIQSAQNGHPRAQYDLAMMYQNGQGVMVDLNQSTFWLKKSAQSGEPEAQYLLAQFYHDGTLGGVNMAQAVHWATESAKRGHVDAQYWLGRTYAEGDGVPMDIAHGKHWFKQAAQRGSQEAQIALQQIPTQSAPTQIAQVRPRPMPRVLPTPVPDFPPAASPMPVERMANPRLAPDPVPTDIMRQVQDQAEASNAANRVSLNGMNPNDILELANTGDKYAQFLVGALYEEGGSGFAQNYGEAARWYRRAARQNYPKAQYNLALLYEDGRGVEQDYNQASQWYTQAAKGGFTKAKNNLGILYVLGKGVKKDHKVAAKLFGQAAREGDVDAAYNLSRLQKG